MDLIYQMQLTEYLLLGISTVIIGFILTFFIAGLKDKDKQSFLFLLPLVITFFLWITIFNGYNQKIADIKTYGYSAGPGMAFFVGGM